VERPAESNATEPPEVRAGGRDATRLLISSREADNVARFQDLPTLLERGDLLVVNESATLPASLPAVGSFGPFRLNLSTRYGSKLWVAEPRWSHSRSGPLPLASGSRFVAAGIPVSVVAPFPGIPRLLFVQFAHAPDGAMCRLGEPIHYGYVTRSFDLTTYQTIFARVPGSAEMPSAGRPFTRRTLAELETRGVAIASIVLHTGISSLETSDIDPHFPPVYPEPFEVPAATAEAINRAHRNGRRVVAVGTTVVRALASSTSGGVVSPTRGFTRAYVHPGREIVGLDGLLTGLHDLGTSHRALLEAFVGVDRIRRAYSQGLAAGFLWHEFGDSHLIWAR
jgi:S-adenosylmethionine:tRNA ribosyltransferase-isomerase